MSSFIDIKETLHYNRVNIILFLLPYVCFPFLCWVKFCSGCYRQVFFHLGDKKKLSLVALDRWLSYTLAIVWGFAWVDSAIVV